MGNVYVDVLEDMNTRFRADTKESKKSRAEEVMDGDILVSDVWEDEESE